MRARTMVRKNSDAFFPRRERKESEEAVTRSTPRSNRTASSDGSDVYFLPASTMERRSMHDPRTRPRGFVWFREKPKCFSRMGARRKPGIRKRIEIFFLGEERRWERKIGESFAFPELQYFSNGRLTSTILFRRESNILLVHFYSPMQKYWN